MPSPPPRPPPSPPSFPKCRPLERGTEYEGGDLTNGIIDGVASPGDCCALCFARPQCGAFSHDRSSRQCMLKATVGWRRMDATFVTSAQLRWPRVATCAPPQRGVYLHGCVIQAPDLSTDVGGVARAAVVGAQSTSTPTSRVLGITGIDATWQECCTLCTATAECAGECWHPVTPAEPALAGPKCLLHCTCEHRPDGWHCALRGKCRHPMGASLLRTSHAPVARASAPFFLLS